MPTTSFTSPADAELLALATKLARDAGRLSAERFFSPQARVRTTKPDGTEVTQADEDVEDFMREVLARTRAQDLVYGEERGGTLGPAPHWVLDPIDGTYCFTRRIASFTNVVAYVDEHGPALSVIHDPIALTTLSAGRGRGCWLDLATAVGSDGQQGTEPPQRARVSGRTTLQGARMLMHDPSLWSEELLLALHRRVRLSVVGSVLQLVTGEADALLVAGTPMGYEDLVPLTVVVDEAGGRITDMRGAPVLDGDGTVLITNGHLHPEFLHLFAGLTNQNGSRTPADGTDC